MQKTVLPTKRIKKAEPETSPAFWIIWRLGLPAIALRSPGL